VIFLAGCCHNDSPDFQGATAAYRRVLWIVISMNAAMFLVEIAAGVAGGSMALQADALDFAGDSATYAISLAVIGRALTVRARAAMLKGLSLGVLGLWVLGATIYRVFVLGQPDAFVMGSIGMLAFAVNVASALLLLRHRNGDANVRSVWLCSRNDAIGNVAVVLAASGVFVSGTAWPDLAVAAVMSGLFLSASVNIVRQSSHELRVAASDLTEDAEPSAAE
jgi:Co/Zn/Cd efflux system component